ncbi:MAG: heme-binding protein [Phycisphaerales bacterium]
MRYHKSIRAAAAALAASAPCLALATPMSDPVQVGGQSEFELETRTGVLEDGERGEYFVAGPMRTTAALPKGYPRPTPAGAMEVKHYPSVRRAEITVEASPRWGMNMAFFPLFRHIKDREIAMTAPVEADLPMMARNAATQLEDGDASDIESRTGEMTVSFLYRTSELGPTGDAEENVRVIDTKPVTVVALGIRGTMNNDRIEREIEKLYGWIADQGDTNAGPDGEQASGRWSADGDPRILGYNGPDVPRRDQWWEVQLPITWTQLADDSATNNPG